MRNHPGESSSSPNSNPTESGLSPTAYGWKEWVRFRVLPLSRPTDLCLLLFVILVVSLFFAIDQPFEWRYFGAYIWKPFVWFAFLLAPIFLILVTEDRVGTRYDLRHTSTRFANGLARFLRDFIPFVICLVVYLNLTDVVTLINPENRDTWLIDIDQTLFGLQLSQWMEQFATPWRTEWMAATYSLFGMYPFILIGFFLARGQWKPFRHLLLAYVMASFIGYLGYITVPAIGPRYYLEYAVDLQGKFFAAVEYAMSIYFYVPRDCFPSLHTANTLVVLGLAYRYHRTAFWVLLPFCLSTVVATVYLRYHYLIDVVAGAAVAGLVLVLAPRLNERWDRWTRQLQEEGVARGVLTRQSLPWDDGDVH